MLKECETAEHVHSTLVTSNNLTTIPKDESALCCICIGPIHDDFVNITLNPVSSTTTHWTCKVCGRNVHLHCMHRWFYKQHQIRNLHNKDSVTCPLCRAETPFDVTHEELDKLPQEGNTVESPMTDTYVSVEMTTKLIVVKLCIMSVFFGDIAILMIIVNHLAKNSTLQIICLIMYWLINCILSITIIRYLRICFDDYSM